jgi:hypothetical protein
MQVRADVSGIDKYINHIEQLVTKAVIIVLGSAVIVALALFFLAARLGK